VGPCETRLRNLSRINMNLSNPKSIFLFQSFWQLLPLCFSALSYGDCIKKFKRLIFDDLSRFLKVLFLENSSDWLFTSSKNLQTPRKSLLNLSYLNFLTQPLGQCPQTKQQNLLKKFKKSKNTFRVG